MNIAWFGPRTHVFVHQNVHNCAFGFLARAKRGGFCPCNEGQYNGIRTTYIAHFNSITFVGNLATTSGPIVT